MSEEGQVAESTATEAPAAPAEAPAGPPPSTRDAGKARARQRARDMQARTEAADVARERAMQQPRVEPGRPEGGQFRSEEADTTATPPEDTAEDLGDPQTQATEPLAETLAEEGAVDTAPTEAAGPPDGWVRVEYPEGHPLRDQGRTYIDVPQDREREVKTLVNAAARRNDLSQIEQELFQERQARLRLEAELQFDREHGSEFWTPEHEHLYQDILTKYGEEQAEVYKQGQLAKAEEARSGVRQQADAQALQQQWRAAGRRFREDAFTSLPQKYPGLTPRDIEVGLKMYETELVALERQAWENSQRLGLSPVEFQRRFTQAMGGYQLNDLIAVAGTYFESREGVARHPSRTAAQQVKQNAAQAEASAEASQRAREAAQRHRKNPHAGLGAQETGKATVQVDAGEDVASLSSGERKRLAKKRAREKGRSYFGFGGR